MRHHQNFEDAIKLEHAASLYNIATGHGLKNQYQLLKCNRVLSWITTYGDDIYMQEQELNLTASLGPPIVEVIVFDNIDTRTSMTWIVNA